jgi:site-specific DNA-methyltransferase (adenine-specific)
MSHEYMFHFVTERWYFFNRNAVGRPSARGTKLPPLDTWSVPPARGSNGHKAAFSEELIHIPILATTPAQGIVLDPFGGSGTTIAYARRLGFRTIAIDIKEEFCKIMADSVLKLDTPQSKTKKTQPRPGAEQVSVKPKENSYA